MGNHCCSETQDGMTIEKLVRYLGQPDASLKLTITDNRETPNKDHGPFDKIPTDNPQRGLLEREYRYSARDFSAKTGPLDMRAHDEVRQLLLSPSRGEAVDLERGEVSHLLDDCMMKMPFLMAMYPKQKSFWETVKNPNDETQVCWEQTWTKEHVEDYKLYSPRAGIMVESHIHHCEEAGWYNGKMFHQDNFVKHYQVTIKEYDLGETRIVDGTAKVPYTFHQLLILPEYGVSRHEHFNKKLGTIFKNKCTWFHRKISAQECTMEFEEDGEPMKVGKKHKVFTVKEHLREPEPAAQETEEQTSTSQNTATVGPNENARIDVDLKDLREDLRAYNLTETPQEASSSQPDAETQTLIERLAESGIAKRPVSADVAKAVKQKHETEKNSDEQLSPYGADEWPPAKNEDWSLSEESSDSERLIVNEL